MGLEQKVVIIGAGYAGTTVARKLESFTEKSHLEVVLIDPREVMVHKFGGARSAVDDKHQQRGLLPRDKIFSNSRNKVIQSSVTSIDEEGKKVVLADGSEVGFDYLVCATGAVNSSIAEPAKGLNTKAEMLAYWKAAADAVKASKNVVVIGGGAVGIEIAGEVAELYKDKNVTIVNSGKEFISNSITPILKSFRKKIKSELTKAGIEYELEARADIDMAAFGDRGFVAGNRQVALSNGKTLEADLLLLGTGAKNNTEIYPPGWLNDSSQIKVNECLQLPSNPNVFALGDIIDLKENKMGYFAMEQAKVVAKNVNQMVRTNPKGVKKYSRMTSGSVMIVPIGTKRGASNMMKMTVGAFMTSRIKGKGLFVSQTWKDLARTKAPPAGN